MGYYAELNTLLRPPSDFDFKSLTLGKKYMVTLERERIFPLHIAILLIDKEWNFYGYAIVNSLFSKDGKSMIEFTVLSLFNEEEKKLYKEKFIFAARQTGEIK